MSSVDLETDSHSELYKEFKTSRDFTFEQKAFTPSSPLTLNIHRPRLEEKKTTSLLLEKLAEGTLWNTLEFLDKKDKVHFASVNKAMQFAVKQDTALDNWEKFQTKYSLRTFIFASQLIKAANSQNCQQAFYQITVSLLSSHQKSLSTPRSNLTNTTNYAVLINYLEKMESEVRPFLASGKDKSSADKVFSWFYGDFNKKDMQPYCQALLHKAKSPSLQKAADFLLERESKSENNLGSELSSKEIQELIVFTEQVLHLQSIFAAAVFLNEIIQQLGEAFKKPQEQESKPANVLKQNALDALYAINTPSPHIKPTILWVLNDFWCFDREFFQLMWQKEKSASDLIPRYSSYFFSMSADHIFKWWEDNPYFHLTLSNLLLNNTQISGQQLIKFFNSHSADVLFWFLNDLKKLLPEIPEQEGEAGHTIHLERVTQLSALQARLNKFIKPSDWLKVTDSVTGCLNFGFMIAFIRDPNFFILADETNTLVNFIAQFMRAAIPKKFNIFYSESQLTKQQLQEKFKNLEEEQLAELWVRYWYLAFFHNINPNVSPPQHSDLMPQIRLAMSILQQEFIKVSRNKSSSFKSCLDTSRQMLKGTFGRNDHHPLSPQSIFEFCINHRTSAKFFLQEEKKALAAEPWWGYLWGSFTLFALLLMGGFLIYYGVLAGSFLGLSISLLLSGIVLVLGTSLSLYAVFKSALKKKRQQAEQQSEVSNEEIQALLASVNQPPQDNIWIRIGGGVLALLALPILLLLLPAIPAIGITLAYYLLTGSTGFIASSVIGGGLLFTIIASITAICFSILGTITLIGVAYVAFEDLSRQKQRKKLIPDLTSSPAATKKTPIHISSAVKHALTLILLLTIIGAIPTGFILVIDSGLLWLSGTGFLAQAGASIGLAPWVFCAGISTLLLAGVLSYIINGYAKSYEKSPKEKNLARWQFILLQLTFAGMGIGAITFCIFLSIFSYNLLAGVALSSNSILLGCSISLAPWLLVGAVTALLLAFTMIYLFAQTNQKWQKSILKSTLGAKVSPIRTISSQALMPTLLERGVELTTAPTVQVIAHQEMTPIIPNSIY